jgi:transposase
MFAEEMGRMDTTTYVGLDVHKATVCVALAESGPRRRASPTRRFREPSQDSDEQRGASAELLLRSRAFVVGGLHRMLTGSGHDCVVVAPSLIPVKAGDRVKTDRREVAMLAKLHRAGAVTPIWIPDAAHEAMRALVRA